MLFGRARSVKGNAVGSTASGKLQLATAHVEQRAAQLSERASAARSEAKAAIEAGNKPLALRQLRRSKQLESQAENMHRTISAVERQADVIEDAALQSQVAHALKESVSSIKQSKEALQGAEEAVDNAQELSDLTEDLQAAFQGMTESANLDLDDEDLEAELQAMATAQGESAAASVTSSTTAPEPLGAQARHISVPSLPEAPQSRVLIPRRREERAALLSCQS